MYVLGVTFQILIFIYYINNYLIITCIKKSSGFLSILTIARKQSTVIYTEENNMRHARMIRKISYHKEVNITIWKKILGVKKFW